MRAVGVLLAANLINPVSRSTALNPPESSANQPNFAPGDSPTEMPDFQGFRGV